MPCHRSNLLIQAQANGFDAIARNPLLFRAISIQLLTNASGFPQTAAQLGAQAAANEFSKVAQVPTLFRAMAVELACNTGDE